MKVLFNLTNSVYFLYLLYFCLHIPATTKCIKIGEKEERDGGQLCGAKPTALLDRRP